MVKMPSESAISIVLDKVPFLEIAQKIFQYYQEKKEEKFLDNITSLCAKEHKDGVRIFDILFRPYVEEFGRANLKKTFGQKYNEFAAKVLKILPKTHPVTALIAPLLAPLGKSFKRMLDELTLQRKGYRVARYVDFEIGTLYDVELSDHNHIIVFKLNQQLRDTFTQGMNKYFRFILGDKIIDKIMNADDFSNRFLQIHREVMDASIEDFVKMIYFDDHESFIKIVPEEAYILKAGESLKEAVTK